MSYSPANRNPEKYREILVSKNRSNESTKPAPVVKLHPIDRESSDQEVCSEQKLIHELLSIDRSQDNELHRLKVLKSELAAKAKESLEKKKITESASTSGKISNRCFSSPPLNIEPERAREMKIVAQTAAISTNEKQAAIKKQEKQSKIEIKPAKVTEASSPHKQLGENSKKSSSHRFAFKVVND